MGKLIRTFRRSSFSDKIFYAIVDILMLAALMMVVIPIMNVISNSISEPSAVLQGKVSIFPKGLSFGGYKAVFADNKIISGYANTILYTVSSTVLGVIVTVLCAYPLSRKDLKGRNTIMFLVTFTMLFSGGIIPNYLLIRSLHLINSRLSLILPGLVNAYNIIIARTFFQSSIPDSLLEAAEIDGCGNIRFFCTIVLPLSKAILAVLALYFAVANWNAWFNAYIYLSEPKKYPLQLVLKEILLANSMAAGGDTVGGADGDKARMDALSEVIKYASIMVSCLPIWCAYPFVQKYFVKGVMIGSIKG